MPTLPDPKRREPPDPSLIREVYVDESSQNRGQELLLGALCIPLPWSAQATRMLHRSRLPELPNGEMKWGKVSLSKLAAYQRFVDRFFESVPFFEAHFHCLCVTRAKINDAKFNDGDREVGFNKEIFQIANKCARLYPTLFHVYPDYRDTPQNPEELRLILNRYRAKKGDRRDWPFRRCQFRDSKTTLLLQLTDILLGAVGFHVNGHNDKPDASPAKRQLASHILAHARISDCTRDTRVAGKFTIWHRNLR